MTVLAPVERWMLPYLQGKCFDFALALGELVDDPVFVGIGSPDYPEHVGIAFGPERYADVRGVLNAHEFKAHLEGDIVEVSRATLELHCGIAGLLPPYSGIADMQKARAAVARAFPHGIEDSQLTSRQGLGTTSRL